MTDNIVDHYDSFTYNLVQLVESLRHRREMVCCFGRWSASAKRLLLTFS